MATKQRYEELLENIRKASQAHREAFRAAGSWQGKERKAVIAARKTLDDFYKQLGVLFSGQLEPLRERFLQGDLNTVSEIITFLEADVPAFRTGYQKEWYYRKLKRFQLTEELAERLREVALARCASNEYRREDSELRRLMIRLADEKFLEQIAAIPSQKGSRVDGHKRRMLQLILNGRKDLREKAKNKSTTS